MPLTLILAARGVTSWLIAIPIFAINLPALPLAILFSIFGGDNPPMSAWTVVAMFAGEIFVSSWAWGIFVSAQIKKKRIF